MTVSAPSPTRSLSTVCSDRPECHHGVVWPACVCVRCRSLTHNIRPLITTQWTERVRDKTWHHHSASPLGKTQSCASVSFSSSTQHNKRQLLSTWARLIKDVWGQNQYYGVKKFERWSAAIPFINTHSVLWSFKCGPNTFARYQKLNNWLWNNK